MSIGILPLNLSEINDKVPILAKFIIPDLALMKFLLEYYPKRIIFETVVCEYCHISCCGVVALVTKACRVVKMRVFQSDLVCVLIHLKHKQFQWIFIILVVIILLEIPKLFHRCPILIITVRILCILVWQELSKILSDCYTSIVSRR